MASNFANETNNQEIMKKRIIFALSLVIAAACQGIGEETGIKGLELGVDASADIIGDTETGYLWDNSDIIGVHVDGMADFHAETNVPFRYDHQIDGFVPVGEGIILKGAERKLCAYYPYIGNLNERPEKQVINTRAQFQTAEGWESMDWMYADTVVTREAPQAHFRFSHMLGQLHLDFKTEDGIAKDFKYTLSGLLHDGFFDPYTGSVSVASSESDDITINAKELTSTLLLMPQNADVDVTVLYDDMTFRGSFSAEIIPGECKVYTVEISDATLDKTLIIKDSGVEKWDEGAWEKSEDVQLKAVEISIFDEGLKPESSAPATRAYTDRNYKTHFEKGDKVGIFGVKDGKVITNMNNRCLTFDGNDWKFNATINYSSSMAGATFYAYAPYKEGIVVDPVDEDPFAGLVSAWEVKESQAMEADFLSSDLITGSAVLTLVDGRFTLDFAMTHRMGLMVMELPMHVYEFDNEPQIADYVASAPEDVVFVNSSGMSVVPFYNPETQLRMLIRKPSEPISLRCTYTNNGEPVESQYDAPDGIQAGTYSIFREGNGCVIERMTLKVGDYYCSDGTLVSYDETIAVPENVVGVVYHIGVPESIAEAEPAITHGLVYSVERVKRQNVDGDPGKYESLFAGDDYVSLFGVGKESIPEGEESSWKWYEHGEYYNDDNVRKFTKDDHNSTDLNGYEYTKSWLSYNGTGGLNALFKTSLSYWRETVVLPAGLTTEWYLADYNEFHTLLKPNEEILDKSLEHAGKDAVFMGTAPGVSDAKYYKGYWTSTLRAVSSVVNYFSLGDEDKETDTIDMKQAAEVSGRYGYFRFSFAF